MILAWRALVVLAPCAKAIPWIILGRIENIVADNAGGKVAASDLVNNVEHFRSCTPTGQTSKKYGICRAPVTQRL
jgi:hypothetical protein